MFTHLLPNHFRILYCNMSLLRSNSIPMILLNSMHHLWNLSVMIISTQTVKWDLVSVSTLPAPCSGIHVAGSRWTVHLWFGPRGFRPWNGLISSPPPLHFWIAHVPADTCFNPKPGHHLNTNIYQNSRNQAKAINILFCSNKLLEPPF